MTAEDMQATLKAEGLDFNNVSSWVGRPRRTLKRAAPTYWEEYVETDTWYQRKLVEDVPPEEMYAALEDSDLSEDEGEESESDEGEEEEDAAFIVGDINLKDEEGDASETDESDNSGDSDSDLASEEEGI